MQDTIALVTGPTSGIGEVTARELARRGAHLILLGRNPTKLEALRDSIVRESPRVRCDLIVADLSDLDTVKTAAVQVQVTYPRVDLLVNNAGAYFGKDRSVSPDGFELTLATNHLGPFALTGLLMDRLEKSPRARIINVSSALYSQAHPDFNDLQLHKGYHPTKAYAQSKLFNILFTRELARRLALQERKMVTHCLHPGLIRTGFARNSNSWMGTMVRIGGVFLASPRTGAETSLYLATAQEPAMTNGDYWVRSRKKVPKHRFINPDNERRLWEVSEELTGVDFL